MAICPPGYKIRDANEEDTIQISQILAHFIRKTQVTWSDGEDEVPTAENMLAKYRDFQRAPSSSHHAPYPWLVIIEDKENVGSNIVGYAYAGPFRTRTGWRFTCENSIYLRPGYERQGLGKALLNELLNRCRAVGYRKMVAAISIDGSGKHAQNDGLGLASVNLHKSCGFVEAGLLTNSGEKFGRVMSAVFLAIDL